MGLTAAEYYALPESERDWWVARHQREVERHTCGHPRSVCSDPKLLWYPQRTVCYPAMEREAAAAKYARLHQDAQWHDGSFTSWSTQPDVSHPYHRDHGVTIWVAKKDYSPDDDFLRGPSLAPPDGVE